MLGIWFGPDLQVEKNWDEVASTQKCAESKLSLKGQAKVANVYIVSIIYYCFTVVSCFRFHLNNLVCFYFKILRREQIPLERLGMP